MRRITWRERHKLEWENTGFDAEEIVKPVFGKVNFENLKIMDGTAKGKEESSAKDTQDTFDDQLIEECLSRITFNSIPYSLTMRLKITSVEIAFESERDSVFWRNQYSQEFIKTVSEKSGIDSMTPELLF